MLLEICITPRYFIELQKQIGKVYNKHIAWISRIIPNMNWAIYYVYRKKKTDNDEINVTDFILLDY